MNTSIPSPGHEDDSTTPIRPHAALGRSTGARGPAGREVDVASTFASTRRRALALAAAVGLLVPAAAGCGGSSETGLFTGSGGSGGGGASSTASAGSSGTGGDHAVACAGAPASLSLGGTWVARADLAVRLEGVAGSAITPCPADQVDSATLIMMINVVQDAADPTKLQEVRATLCSLHLPTATAVIGACSADPQNLVTTQFTAPPALIDGLPKVTTSLAAGSLDGSAAGAALTAGPFALTIGSKKPGAAMPIWDTETASCNQGSLGHTSACEEKCVSDCPSLRDDDQDSFPGVSVDVCGATADDTKKGKTCHATSPDEPGTVIQGRAFIDIELDPKLSGVAKSSCEIEGHVGAEWLYNVVGADIYLGGAPLTTSLATRSLPSFHVDEKASALRMVRIDGKFGAPDWKVDPAQASAACQALLQRVDEL